MSSVEPAAKKKYYTPAQANATLPLLRVILRDITALAHELRELHRRVLRLQNTGKLSGTHEEELDALISEFENGQERMRGFEEELLKLGVELKDYFTGLVDFYALHDGREIYLCWKLGEPEVAHWHELDAGFSGRQRLTAKVANR